jgi:hypothetical protein
MPRAGAPQRRFPSDGERLTDLRRRAAASENIDTLRRTVGDAIDLGWTSPQLRGEIDAFIGRANEKIERLVAVRPRRSHARQPNGGAPGVTIRMRISEWSTDARGIRSRVCWNSADGLSPPTPMPPP